MLRIGSWLAGEATFSVPSRFTFFARMAGPLVAVKSAVSVLPSCWVRVLACSVLPAPISTVAPLWVVRSATIKGSLALAASSLR
ncbi:hypothetical protein NGUA26_02386 [Salmonella enterica]|nr:hypothetical protein NGUA26_02386 [Salmonella enterica]